MNNAAANAYGDVTLNIRVESEGKLKVCKTLVE